MSAIAFGHTDCTSHPACGCVKDRGTLADNNEALAFSSIDIEVTGFVIWEATSGRRHEAEHVCGLRMTRGHGVSLNTSRPQAVLGTSSRA
jgi:hypothetical protein